MDKRHEIGKRIAKLRDRERKTQKELGKIIGVSGNAVSTYENGDAYPTVDNLIKLAEIGRVSLEWLIMGTDENTPLRKLLTPEELRLLYEFRKAPEDVRGKIVKIVEVMVEEDTTKE